MQEKRNSQQNFNIRDPPKIIVKRRWLRIG